MLNDGLSDGVRALNLLLRDVRVTDNSVELLDDGGVSIVAVTVVLTVALLTMLLLDAISGSETAVAAMSGGGTVALDTVLLTELVAVVAAKLLGSTVSLAEAAVAGSSVASLSAIRLLVAV